MPNTGGPIRTEGKRPNNIRFTAAIQREVGKNVVVDAAYVGTRTRYIQRDDNINEIPFMRRFDPEFRDPTVTPSASNPGALPDAFLRQFPGTATSYLTADRLAEHDSLQMQVTRRFTAASKWPEATPGRGSEKSLFNGNPLNTITERETCRSTCW